MAVDFNKHPGFISFWKTGFTKKPKTSEKPKKDESKTPAEGNK